MVTTVAAALTVLGLWHCKQKRERGTKGTLRDFLLSKKRDNAESACAVDTAHLPTDMSSDERGLQQLFEQLDRSKTGRIGAEELDFFLVIMGVHDATKRSAQVYNRNARYTLRLLFTSRLRKKKGKTINLERKGSAILHACIKEFLSFPFLSSSLSSSFSSLCFFPCVHITGRRSFITVCFCAVGVRICNILFTERA